MSNDEPIKLTEKETNLIKQCREIKFGQCIIHIENGQPIRIEEVKKSIKL